MFLIDLPSQAPSARARFRRASVAAVAASTMAGASPASADGIQAWPDIQVTMPVAKDWTIGGEVIGRTGSDDRTSQFITRVLVGHAVNRHAAIGVSITHYVNENPGTANNSETRIIEQANWRFDPIGRVRLSTRARLEQRFITGADRVGWRYRQQVRAALPLATANGPAAVISIEPFFALNLTSSQRHTVDQLRCFVGLAMPLSKHADIEFGYLNQRLYRARSTVENHVVPITLSLHY